MGHRTDLTRLDLGPFGKLGPHKGDVALMTRFLP